MFVCKYLVYVAMLVELLFLCMYSCLHGPIYLHTSLNFSTAIHIIMLLIQTKNGSGKPIQLNLYMQAYHTCVCFASPGSIISFSDLPF